MVQRAGRRCAETLDKRESDFDIAKWYPVRHTPQDRPSSGWRRIGKKKKKKKKKKNNNWPELNAARIGAERPSAERRSAKRQARSAKKCAANPSLRLPPPPPDLDVRTLEI